MAENILVWVCMDRKAYKQKPDNKTEAGKQAIGATQLAMVRPMQISFEEFTRKVCTGYSFRPVKAVGMSQDDFIEADMIAVDIDNKGDYLSIEEAKERAEDNRLTINFMYPSFSDKPDHRRYRMIFLLDKPIKDKEKFKDIYSYFVSVFPNCDTSCNNPAHFFYGTQAAPIEINTDRINSLKSINQRANNLQKQQGQKKPTAKKRKKPTQVKYSTAANGENIEAIKRHDIAYLKAKLHRSKQEFSNRDDFFQWLYHDVNLSELLEVPKNFNCIFHEDNTESASVFQTSYGTWLYKCFSDNCEVDKLNVKELVELLGGFTSEYAVLEFIKAIYNVSIKETAWAIEQKANIDSIMDCFNSQAEHGFINCCPTAYKTTKNATVIFNAVLRIARNTIYPERTAENGNIIFYMSVRQVAKEAGKSCIDHVNKYLKMLIYHGMLEIVPLEKVPKSMRIKALSNKQEKHNCVQFYSIPSWVIRQKQFIEQQGQQWKANGYRIKGVSYEMFYRSEGAAVASKLYPQTANYTDKQGKIQQKAPSKKSNERTSDIASVILEQIQAKGYAMEKEVIEQLGAVEYRTLKDKDGFTYTAPFYTDTQIKRSIKEIMDSYSLKKVRANKELKALYNIDLPPKSNPIIIIEE